MDAMTETVSAERAAGEGGPELSVVLPTRNERDNVGPVVARLHEVLAGVDWEAIFVDDDSTDGTIPAVRALARSDRRVRLVHRIGRRGLSSACIEGIQASSAPYVAVMDADMQHDESLLPAMLAALKAGDCDLVVGSRYVAGGGIEGWDERRAGISSFATKVNALLLPTGIADPMSGFFMLTREAFDGSVRQLSAMGFKILVDIVASSKVKLRIRELPYTFRPRVAGESKLDALVAWEYGLLLLDKLIGHIVPVRFVLFSAVGTVGVAVNQVVLSIAYRLVGMSFLWAQSIATTAAMIGNFALNNVLTHRDRRLKGWRLVGGLASFCLVCGVGAVANVGVSSFLVDSGLLSWWLAGLAGAAFSAVWNYAVSSVVTWKRR
jgi:dolichol-phosphate mannosyltransferase